MTRLLLSLDMPTAAEAVLAARSLVSCGVAVRVGPRLLSRVGPGVIASLQAFLPVLADARLSGAVREVGAAARSLAALGAAWVTVDGTMEAAGLTGTLSAVRRHGSKVYATTVPPEAAEPDSGRGRAVSLRTRSIAGTGIAGVLGTTPDLGVVAQVAPDLDVVVFGADSPEEVRDAVVRGAGAVVVDGRIASAADPARAIQPYIEVLRSA